jgi:hypothetical protein
VKRVRYRGGILEFEIPDDWTEESAAEGAAYYRDRPGTGTLRLRTVTACPPETVQQRHVVEAAASSAQPEDPAPELLPNGNALRCYWREGVEGGVPVRVRYWQLASAAPPSTVRVAIFSYTVLPSESAEAVLAMLDGEIRQAAFTSLTAEEVQGLVKAAKPWWRVW